MPLYSIHCEHLAMATRWRCWLQAEDQDRLAALAEWWADEIDRWDRMLSKFEPASEVTRLNRAPAGKRRKVQPELMKLLCFCKLAWSKTSGLFDVTATSLTPDLTYDEYSFRVDPVDGTFVWNQAQRHLDFGGVAKGYVLDHLAKALYEFGVTAALLDAGGSSLLTWDDSGDAAPWQVSLTPGGEAPSQRLLSVKNSPTESSAWPFMALSNAALSYSATRAPGSSSGQTIDPRVGRELPDSRACVVLTQSAAWAEVLSTAALCMGEAAAAKYIVEENSITSRLGWIDGEAVRWSDAVSPI